MKTIILCAVMISLVSTGEAYAADRKKFKPLKILFVDSETTFEQAREEELSLWEGLCVSMRFYNKVPWKTKQALEKLIADNLSRDFFATCLYGAPFDQGLAIKLFGKEPGCQPPGYAGVYRVKNNEGKAEPLHFCNVNGASEGFLKSIRIAQELSMDRDSWKKKGYRVE